MDRPSDKPTKPVLRLVPKAAESSPVEPPPNASAAPPPKSALGRLLSAYADAIDRDVKLLLDL